MNVKRTYQLGLVVKIGGLGDAAGSVNKGWSSDEWSETARTVGPVETTKDGGGEKTHGGQNVERIGQLEGLLVQQIPRGELAQIGGEPSL